MITFMHPRKRIPERLSVLMSALVILLLIAVFVATFNKVAHARHNALKKPLIGILMNDGGQGGYSQFPWYAIRQNYSEVVADLGGIPVFIGHDIQSLDDYLKTLDGIVLTGGDFQSSEEVFTTGLKREVDPKKHPREALEYALIKKAYAQDVPILGICAGMQNMNVAMGGTLIRSLKETLKTPIEHRNEQRDEVQHGINLVPKTKLYEIIKTNALRVNSNHNAGVGRIPDILIINARATDGVIEGIESPHKRFFIGVMWHPEFLLSPEEKMLWKAFIDASAKYQQERS